MKRKNYKKLSLKKINNLIANDLHKKITLQDIEKQAKMILEHQNLTKEQIHFYKGFLRAFEILQKYGFIKEE